MFRFSQSLFNENSPSPINATRSKVIKQEDRRMLTSVLPPAINATRSKVLRPILWALCLIAQSLLAAQPVAWWTFDDPASLGRDSAGTTTRPWSALPLPVLEFATTGF